MGSIQRVLALYQEFVKVGESVELRLWSRGGKECFSFSQTLGTLPQSLSRMTNRRRKMRKRVRKSRTKLKEIEIVPTSKEAPMVRSMQTLTNAVVSRMTPRSMGMSQITPSSVVMSQLTPSSVVMS